VISFKYTVIISIFVGPYALAQSRVEKLTQALTQADGTQKVELLNKLTYEFISVDNAKAMQYCDQALSLANKLGYQKGAGRAYTYRGVYEYLSGAFSDGRTNLRRGLNLAIKSGDRETQGYSLVQIANSFLNQAQLDSSLYFFNESYTLLKDSANPASLSKLYRNLSALYGIQSKDELQKKYLVRAIRIRTLLIHTQGLQQRLIFRPIAGREQHGHLTGAPSIQPQQQPLQHRAGIGKTDLPDQL